jgi:hypothetical protein
MNSNEENDEIVLLQSLLIGRQAKKVETTFDGGIKITMEEGYSFVIRHTDNYWYVEL